MNRKISIILIILAAASTGGILVYLFLFPSVKPVVDLTTKPTAPATQSAVPVTIPETKKIEKIDTSDWKLYQNKQYGYELKYPAGWEIGTTFGADPYTFSAPDFHLPNCSTSGGGACPNFAIGNIHTAEKGETIDRDINFNTNDIIIAEKATKIGGEEASFIEYYQANYGRADGKMGLVRQEMKVIHNGVLYRIYIHESAADINKIKTSADWEYGKTLEAMLESFKFIESIADPEQEIQTFLAKKYNRSEAEVKVTIGKQTDSYAAGSILFGQGGPGEGGMFLAMKKDNVWQVVWDGNGSVDCQKLKQVYHFPDEILKPNFCD